jgi:hypothetical protein
VNLWDRDSKALFTCCDDGLNLCIIFARFSYLPILSTLWLTALREYATVRLDPDLISIVAGESSLALDPEYAASMRDVVLPVGSNSSFLHSFHDGSNIHFISNFPAVLQKVVDGHHESVH